MDKFLCIMAGYDSDTEKRLSDLQARLYALGFTGEQTKGLPQHITLGMCKPEKENEAVNKINSIAERTEKFPVSFSHVGIFGGSKVLFIAPVVTRQLLDLKENFGDSFGWTPHTTMLIDSPDSVIRATPVILSSFEEFHSNIDCLYLYEFWPTRFICKAELK